MKKKYIKPYMKEVKLRSHYRLLVGSDEPTNARPYGGEFG